MRLLRVVLLGALLVACDDGGSSCVDGMSIACACPGGGTGAQVCRMGAYEACICGDPQGDGGTPMDGATLDGATPHDGGTASDGGTRPDGATGCSDGVTRCGATGVERCQAGAWVADTTCALSCSGGACVDEPASCSPGETRCYRTSVQRCNRDGSAWLFDSVCADGCDAGLCTGACTAGEDRCNGDVRQTCASDGASWSSAETCAMGCEDRVCVEAELSLPGTVLDLSGTHVYAGCVDIDLGGELRVPAGETLEIRARCLNVSASSHITIGSGATLRVRVTDSAQIDGTVSGGSEAFVESLGTLRLAGSVSSARTILRADDLGIEAGGSTAGTSLDAALYGSAFSNAGAHAGIVSVMPPTPIDSPTHPSGAWWNLTDDDVVVTWSKPFASVRGYYVTTGDVVPGPATGSFRTTESIAIPASSFGPGENRVRIVSVNADSEIGTYYEELVVRLNVRAPSVSSTSHPNETAWGGANDVYLAWTDPSGVPAETFTGYFYAWDRQADTVPGPSSGTFDDRRMILLADQAPGIWFFHIVNIDRLGRTSPTVAHYQVRIGADPGAGNVAGSVTDATTGDPIDGATVLVNGGLLRTRTGPTGDYTFRGVVPASSEPYRITARARGYASAEATVTVASGGAVVQHFILTPSAGPPGPAIHVGWEVPVESVTPYGPTVAIGPPGRFIWARNGTSSSEEEVAIARLTGESIHSEPTMNEYYQYPRSEVGWDGTRFYAVDYYQCGYDASFSYGSGWSCMQMRTWDAGGAVLSGWRRWRNSGQTGSPSAAWNGTSYGTFFVSYGTLYHRELTADLEFADGGDGVTHDVISTDHDDTRQSATTRAIWDGSGYAVAWNIGRSGTDSTPTVFFGRWSRTLEVLQARIEVDDTLSSSELDLAWDGTQYHVLYVDKNGTHYDVVLRTISTSGVLGARTVIGGGFDYSLRSPSLAFDGRNLLVAWEEGSTGVSHLEVRQASDHALIEAHDVDGSRPRVDASGETGQGVLLYVRDGAVRARAIEID